MSYQTASKDLAVALKSHSRNAPGKASSPVGLTANGCIFSNPLRRLLKVQSEDFRAGAVWEKVNGVWSCISTATILHWMKGMAKDQAAINLLKMGARWHWCPCKETAKPNRNPASFAGVTVKRDDVIPLPTDLSYEERQKQRTTSDDRRRALNRKRHPKHYGQRHGIHSARFNSSQRFL